MDQSSGGALVRALFVPAGHTAQRSNNSIPLD